MRGIKDVKDYLLSKIIKKEGCWEYQGSTVRGYCRIQLKGIGHQAHRVSYETFIGEIPEGLTIDHLCENKICINPDHLEAVTMKVNVLRGTAVSAINARKTHCNKGHEFSGRNLVMKKKSKSSGMERVCRICKNSRQIEYNRRKAVV